MNASTTFPFPDHTGIDPSPQFRELGRLGPLVPVTLRSGVPAVLVHRHQDVVQVLTDPAFSRGAAARFGLTERSTESLALNAVDAPDHTRRRRLVAHAFTHRQTALLRPEVEALAERLVKEMTARGEQADLLADFAVPLTATVISKLLGLEASEVPRLLPLVERMMSTGAFGKEEVRAAHHSMFAAFETYLSGAKIDDSGLLASLRQAMLDGEEITPREAVHLAYGLLIAAYETTANQLGLCGLILLRDKALRDQLRANPELLPAAITEMLRLTSLNATGGVPHVAQRPVSVGGVRLEAGTVVLPLTDGANRDPEVFPQPDTFRLDRPNRPHLTFGQGRHRCPGAPLAQMELEVALATVLRLLPDLRLAVPEEDLEWRTGMYVRGVRRLPITW
ncbi:cytochrome P450 [Streptomyces rubradiris]|uniref:cytochrome P450 n=1 Tax=Streptomyces rubradiris TaxID=285531 RepID=UPI0033CAE3C5